MRKERSKRGKYTLKRHSVTQPSDPTVRLIPLNAGENAIVDAADYDYLMQWNWTLNITPPVKYAMRYEITGKQRIAVRMHSLLTGYPRTDHVNGNGLDNRRANLRQATQAENRHNTQVRRDNISGYCGVSKRGNRYLVRITLNGKRHCLGTFDSPTDAARAYDAAAIEAFGKFARPNFEVQL